MNRLATTVGLAVLIGTGLVARPAGAQGVLVPRRPIPVPGSYAVKSLEIDTRINDQIATVQVQQTFVNTGSATMEVQFLFPLPYDGAIDQMTLLVDGKEFPARLLKREEARRIYEEIVRRRRDPALLEYVGKGMFQTSVFPLPAGAERKVSLRYTQLCRKDANLTDFLFPLSSAKHSSKPIESLRITTRIHASAAIKNVYSPSHQVTVKRIDERTVTCSLEASHVVPLEDFRLLYDAAEGELSANVISYRPEGEDGYFLMLASPKVERPEGEQPRKTVVFVVDRSGSMSGKKIEQAKGALRFVLNNLREGDTFNIVAYDSVIESFRPELQRFDDTTRQEALAFVEGLYAGGSTNIDGALKTALGMLADSSRPNYLIFLTDGLPTAGVTGEAAIVENARNANGVKARLFAFGVGYDVNSRLLDRLARANQGLTEYVKPNEDIEERVSRFYAKIGAPALTDLKVAFAYDEPASTAEPAPIYLTLPRQLPDLFAGEQFVWVGRYRKAGPVKVTLSGNVGDKPQSFDFPATLVGESKDETNGFVSKLWAMRRIGDIIDELDLKGQNQELVDELVALSVKHGILTQYTAFLADERTDLAATAMNRREARLQLERLSQVGGQGGFAQRQAKGQLQFSNQAPAAGPASLGLRDAARTETGPAGGRLRSKSLGRGVVYQDADGKARRVQSVQVVGQKTFFFRGNRWYDSTVTKEQEKKAIVVEQFSDAYFALARKHGATLAKYLALNEPVMLNLEGETYQIDPPKE